MGGLNRELAFHLRGVREGMKGEIAKTEGHLRHLLEIYQSRIFFNVYMIYIELYTQLIYVTYM